MINFRHIFKNLRKPKENSESFEKANTEKNKDCQPDEGPSSGPVNQTSDESPSVFNHNSFTSKNHPMTNNTSNNTTSNNTTAHQYYESSLDILDKINALASIIESEGFPKTLVYCNLPSDTDLVEAALRKRGIAARKLIGNVPQYKINQSLALINSGVLIALVVTDIAARNIDLSEFELLVSYSIHSDPDVYTLRTMAKGASSAKKSISLVSPLDRTHFHYLKKVVDFEIEKIELNPTAESTSSRLALIEKSAAKNSAENISDSIKSLSASLLQSPNKETLVEYLLHSYLSYGFSSELEETINNFRGQEEDSEDNRYESSRSRGRRTDEHSHRHNSREAREGSEGSANLPVARKTIRIYLGKGQEQGLNNNNIVTFLLAKDGSLTCQRLNVRNNYTFIDLDEDKADKVIEVLSEKDSPYCGATINKAVTITSRGTQSRENYNEDDPKNFDSQNDQNDDVPLNEASVG